MKTIKSTSSQKSIGFSPSRVESVWVQAVDFKSTSSRIQVKSSRIGGLKSLPGLPVTAMHRMRLLVCVSADLSLGLPSNKNQNVQISGTSMPAVPGTADFYRALLCSRS